MKPIGVIFFFGIVFSILFYMYISRMPSTPPINFPNFSDYSGDRTDSDSGIDDSDSGSYPDSSSAGGSSAGGSSAGGSSAGGSSAGSSVVRTTQPPPANTYEVQIYGHYYDASGINNIPKKILNSWTRDPLRDVKTNTLSGVSIDLANGRINLDSSKTYSVFMNVKIYLNDSNNPVTLPSQGSYIATVGVSINDPINQIRDARGSLIAENSNTIKYDLLNCSLSINSTAGFPTSQSIPYIYVNSPSYFSGKTSTYADITIRIIQI